MPKYKDIKCPECGGVDFLTDTDWVFTQEVRGGRPFPEFRDIVKSKTITKKVTCTKCKHEVPKDIFKTWHLDQNVM